MGIFNYFLLNQKREKVNLFLIAINKLNYISKEKNFFLFGHKFCYD